MSNSNTDGSGGTSAWILPAAIGFVAALLLWTVASWGFFSSVFAGVVIAIILWAVFGWMKGAEASQAETPTAKAVSSTSTGAAAQSGTKTASAAATNAAPAPAAEAHSTHAVASGLADIPAETEEKPAAAKKAPAKKTAAKKTATSKTATSNAGAKKTAAKSASATKTAAKKSGAGALASTKSTAAKSKAAKSTAAKSNSAKSGTAKSTAAAAKPKRAPVAADGKPALLTKARAGGADDLKLISGVGPKLEQTLNEMGIWHFDQVAGLRKKEVEWVDARLKFKGRIERDGWIQQSKILAKGGETEFSRRKKK